MRARAVTFLCALLAATAIVAAPAWADGDPASDVLLGQNVFYPYQPEVSASLQKALNAETAAATKAHFPIKVALIGSRVDLGVITQLFGQPQRYAKFLDQEISYPSPQPLLVVMAAGYGTQGLPAAAQAAVPGLKPPPAGAGNEGLAQAALTAVRTLAKADGHPLPAAAGGGGGATGFIAVALVIAAVTTAAVLVTARRRAGRRPDERSPVRR